MASLCEKMGADINWVRKGLGSDDRIGNKFLYPGVGFGGSCLPKDILALLRQAEEQDCSLSVVEATQEANHRQKGVMTSKLQAYFADFGGLHGRTIAVLGLSFKPDTDDMREAPALVLIQDLLRQEVKLRLFDPVATTKAQAILGSPPSIHWCSSELEAAEDADAIVLMTEWKQFRLLNFQALLQGMKGRAFFDGRNQYKPEEMAQRGFDYISIGRQAAYSATIDEEIPLSSSIKTH
jgi:UDPglucose 6-dehydrogenase